MKKLLLFSRVLIITICISVYSCDVRQSEEYKKLASENNSLKEKIDSLNNTPDRIYYRGANYFKDKNWEAALVEFNKIKSLYEGSEFYGKASLKIRQLKKIIKKKEREIELRLKLKFKVLKEQSNFIAQDLKIRTFGHNLTSRFDYDRYDDYYNYRQAKRGFKYLSFDAVIESKINTPLLPAFFVYILEDGVLKRISDKTGMDIEFYKWEDYGTYLGNDADYSNDFERTKSIRFDIGDELKISDYKGKEIYLVATKEGQMVKEYNSLRNPPISYKKSSRYLAPPTKILTPDNFDSELILIKKIKS